MLFSTSAGSETRRGRFQVSSTDLGVFKPLTVSAQDLLELEELIEDVDPNGNEADPALPPPDLLLPPA